MRFSAEVDDLLVRAIVPLPLLREEFPPPIARLNAREANRLFPQARHPEAALAGLALQLADWQGAHEIAQHVNSPEGSYWHAIIHRLEPDYDNAAYWFRRAGNHQGFLDLAENARLILAENSLEAWSVSQSWNPATFSAWVREAIESKDLRKQNVVQKLQQAEINGLFLHCAKERC